MTGQQVGMGAYEVPCEPMIGIDLDVGAGVARNPEGCFLHDAGHRRAGEAEKQEFLSRLKATGRDFSGRFDQRNRRLSRTGTPKDEQVAAGGEE